MAFTCGFFNSVNGDRKYNSQQLSQLFDGIIVDGVFAHYGTHFAITPVSGRTINVGSGRCWFNHVWGLNDGNTTLTLDAADASAKRIDAVIIEIDASDPVRNAFIKIKKGAAGGAKPTMTRTSTLNQYPLAYVTLNAGATSVAASNIQVVVGTSECPFATGVLENVDIDNLFDQWEGQFTEWFSGVQASLSGNVVTNLQNQITQLSNNKADKTEVNSKIDGIYKIGDIVQSSRNLEAETNGKFLACDGRTISYNTYKTYCDLVGGNYKFDPIPISDGYVGRIPVKLGNGLIVSSKKSSSGNGNDLTSYNAAGTKLNTYSNFSSYPNLFSTIIPYGNNYITSKYVSTSSTITSTIYALSVSSSGTFSLQVNAYQYYSGETYNETDVVETEYNNLAFYVFSSRATSVVTSVILNGSTATKSTYSITSPAYYLKKGTVIEYGNNYYCWAIGQPANSNTSSWVFYLVEINKSTLLITDVTKINFSRGANGSFGSCYMRASSFDGTTISVLVYEANTSSNYQTNIYKFNVATKSFVSRTSVVLPTETVASTYYSANGIIYHIGTVHDGIQRYIDISKFVNNQTLTPLSCINDPTIFSIPVNDCIKNVNEQVIYIFTSNTAFGTSYGKIYLLDVVTGHVTESPVNERAMSISLIGMSSSSKYTAYAFHTGSSNDLSYYSLFINRNASEMARVLPTLPGHYVRVLN